jgi:hypothetical protein
MSKNIGNLGLFCDLAGTLVKMDDTRQLPLGSDGKIVVYPAWPRSSAPFATI